MIVLGLDISNDCSECYEDELECLLDEYLIPDVQEKYKLYISQGEVKKILSEVKDSEFIFAKESLESRVMRQWDIVYTTPIEDTVLVEKVQEAFKYKIIEFKDQFERILEKIEAFSNIEITDGQNQIAKDMLEFVHEPIDADEDPEHNVYSKKFRSDTWSSSNVSETRMGSYGTIHHGRTLASRIHNHCLTNGIELELKSEVTQKLTKEELIDIIYEIEDTEYESELFDNLCNHSDCDGIYVPTQERISFEKGSSVLLLYELYLLYQLGVYDLLAEIILETDAKLSQSIGISPEESQLYHEADICLWVLRKMMYHAASSVYYEDVIVFC